MMDAEHDSLPHIWYLKQPFGWKSLLVLLLIIIASSISAERMQLDRMASQIGDFALEAVGLRESSQIGRGMGPATCSL